jgi:hypothetical protein
MYIPFEQLSTLMGKYSRAKFILKKWSITQLKDIVECRANELSDSILNFAPGDLITQLLNNATWPNKTELTRKVWISCVQYFLKSSKLYFERRGFKPGGGRRIFKGGIILGTSPPGGTLSCFTSVVNLLHVKEHQAARGPLSKIIGHFPSKVSVEALRWADHSFKESCRLWIELIRKLKKRRGPTRAVESFKKKKK